MITFSIQTLALKCAYTLKVFGVKASLEEQESLMEIALMNNDLEAIEHFLDDGSRETIGNFLLKATKTGSPAAVRIILDKMEAVGCLSELSKVTNNLGNTVLHEAAVSRSQHSEKVMEMLIKKEPGLLEIENKDGRTPLHVAAYGMYAILHCNNHKSRNLGQSKFKWNPNTKNNIYMTFTNYVERSISRFMYVNQVIMQMLN